MFCRNCGKEINNNDLFCANCGEKLVSKANNPEKKNGRNRKSIFLFVAVVLLGMVFVVSAIHFLQDSGYAPDEEDITTIAMNTKIDPIKTTVFDPGKLYRPPTEKFCNQYTRYISGYFEGQGYAKMRFGPSKSKYNVIGQISNGSIVTVQTKSVDGWTLIYYEGTEGWVRSDFLFKTYDDCFDKIIIPDIECCGYLCYVDVTDEYDGEPLNMRSGPSKDYSLITQVPDGSEVYVWGESRTTEDWIYISYHEQYGWVLSKYVFQYAEVGDKPVMYLYPEIETDVQVMIELNEMYFSCTYPEYKNGWSVVAKPDGTLINKDDGKEYSYLYWELYGKQDYDFSKGFVVKGSDTAIFLQRTLSQIGLTPKEYNEFIVYWLPKMQQNNYNLISFQSDKYTDNVRLNISPKPDSMLRVFMAYKALDEYMEIEPQNIDSFKRKGFTVVEWGGAEVKN